jgi:hypothetical protein
MHLLTLCYILNATFLLLHEIESAFEREWEILKLPGKITGFLLLHVPLVLALLYGLLEVDRRSQAGAIIAVVAGAAGLLPFLVHKLIVRKKDRFNRAVSNAVIYLNVAAGIGTIAFAIALLV